MKLFFLTAFFFASLNSIAQQPQGRPLYVAAKTGLSIREKPENGSKVLDKIPYGTKITLLDEVLGKSIITEGIEGYWQKVKYNNKTGYIIDSYLFPWAPPKSTTKDMKTYLTQVAVPFGTKLIVKSGTMGNISEDGWQLTKQLYKNGAEWHEMMGYEYGGDTYFLPNFTLQQGFLLLRLLPEFKEAFGEKDEFPTENKTFTKGEIEYKITIDNGGYEDFNFIKKISVDFSDGASYYLEMYMLDNQLIISYSSGV